MTGLQKPIDLRIDTTKYKIEGVEISYRTHSPITVLFWAIYSLIVDVPRIAVYYLLFGCFMLLCSPIIFFVGLCSFNFSDAILSIWFPIRCFLTPFVLIIAIILECFIYQNASGLIVCATIWPFYVYDQTKDIKQEFSSIESAHIDNNKLLMFKLKPQENHQHLPPTNTVAI